MNFDKILTRIKEQESIAPVTDEQIDQKAFQVGSKIIELGFDDAVLGNHRTISRYLANMILGTADRGLFITGPVGTGKTLAMMLIQKQTHLRRRTAGFVTAPDVAAMVNEKGSYTAITALVDEMEAPDWRKGIWDGHTYRKVDLILDDLGAETDAVHYGVRTEPMIELIAARYDLWKRCGARTHVTTNLNMRQIKERYGDRIESRLREMCYVTRFEGKDRRL